MAYLVSCSLDTDALTFGQRASLQFTLPSDPVTDSYMMVYIDPYGNGTRSATLYSNLKASGRSYTIQTKALSGVEMKNLLGDATSGRSKISVMYWDGRNYIMAASENPFFIYRSAPEATIALLRVLDGAPNDEGTHLRADASIDWANVPDSVVGVTFVPRARLYYSNTGSVSTESPYIEFTGSQIENMRSGVTGSDDLITREFSILDNWSFLFELRMARGNGTLGYEYITQELSVSRAFANAHLSGALYSGGKTATAGLTGKQIGGAAFGKFSGVVNELADPDREWFGDARDGMLETAFPFVPTYYNSDLPCGRWYTTGYPLVRRYLLPVTSLNNGENNINLPFRVGYLLNIYGSVVTGSDPKSHHPVNSYYSSSFRCYARVKTPASGNSVLTVYVGANVNAGCIVIEYIKE